MHFFAIPDVCRDWQFAPENSVPFLDHRIRRDFLKVFAETPGACRASPLTLGSVSDSSCLSCSFISCRPWSREMRIGSDSGCGGLSGEAMCCGGISGDPAMASKPCRIASRFNAGVTKHRVVGVKERTAFLSPQRQTMRRQRLSLKCRANS